jgi:adenine-specific DNA-methyltransferase
MSLLEMDNKLVEFMRNKAIEMDVDTENPAWYLYGRTQALNDVKYNKICVNNLIRNSNDIKLYFLINNDKEQFGVYSGYYIPIYNKSIGYKIMEVLRYDMSEDFIDYIKAVGKYKNGGYYTFSSKELEMWFNYCTEKHFF